MCESAKIVAQSSAISFLLGRGASGVEATVISVSQIAHRLRVFGIEEKSDERYAVDWIVIAPQNCKIAGDALQRFTASFRRQSQKAREARLGQHRTRIFAVGPAG